VRVVDNFFKNRQLATIFEAKVGNGTLVFSSIDVSSNLEQRTEAANLRSSILQYMNSSAFNPVNSVTIDALKEALLIKTK
jgi:hypothetical protein